MMKYLKYLKAEAEIIKFDNSDVVTASVCQDENSVGDNCANGGNYQTQSANCRSFIWWIVQEIINLINTACGSSGWWFSSNSADADGFAGESGDRADF